MCRAGIYRAAFGRQTSQDSAQVCYSWLHHILVLSLYAYVCAYVCVCVCVCVCATPGSTIYWYSTCMRMCVRTCVCVRARVCATPGSNIYWYSPCVDLVHILVYRN